VSWVSKRELFEQADILTIHLVLSDRSRGLVDAEALGWMKPTARLVNTARGPIVDEHALAQALENGRLAGAALDVYSEEPLPADHPFRHLPTVLATPHIGYVSEQNYRQFYEQMIEDIKAWAKNTPIRLL
jgi:phosphoglycerate dehydrogenase-like enzyme